MKRVSDPEIRKKQILDTAMQMFYEKGYDNTSLEDIAEKLQIVKGLCYRYFDSKQKLFYAVMEEYTKDCCESLITIIHDSNNPFISRILLMEKHLLAPEKQGKYHNFFHKQGNEAMHEQLALKMCKYMMPHIIEELKKETQCKNVQISAQFIMYGLIGIWLENDEYSIKTECELKKITENILQA